jgi:hypothetical protein
MPFGQAVSLLSIHDARKPNGKAELLVRRGRWTHEPVVRRSGHACVRQALG